MAEQLLVPEHMQNPQTREPFVISGVRPNAVEAMVLDSINDPELWGKEREAFFAGNSFGLSYARDEWETPIAGHYEVENPDETWVALVYGQRVMPADRDDIRHVVKLDSTDLEVITQIHTELAATVLEGENMRVATLTTPPNPKDFKDPANNDLWLSLIHDGQWPIMLAHFYGSSEPKYFAHDYADFHLGNMALFPREVQDIITEASRHELAWRSRRHAGEVKTKALLLFGEGEFDKSPWSSGERGNTMLSEDGIMKIDNLTDVKSYLPLLAFLVADSENSPEERLQKAHANEFGENDSAKKTDSTDSLGLRSIKSLLADVVNYNTRHREQRNATQDEVDEAFAGFEQGVLRVARKIRGDFEPTS